MSIVSNTHNICILDKSTKAFQGQRLSKHSWKTTKEGIKPESKAVSIPLITAAEIEQAGDALTNHLIAYLETVQDAMIKEMIVNGKTEVNDAQISIAAITEYLDSESSGGRLTKEDAAKWFKSTLEDNIALALAEKLGVSEQPTQTESEQIYKIVKEFEDKVSGLAGGKTSYPIEVAKAVQKALDFVEDKEDPIYVRFSKRLEKMQEVKSTSLLDAL